MGFELDGEEILGVVGGDSASRILLELSISEGVSDSTSSKGTSMVASSGCSEEGSRRVPTGDRLIDLTLSFKLRKVSMIRDFPLGCDRVAGPVTRPNEQATND
ncbi:hypothetical protein J1N35_015122 [Gossypium stocksii]|uniref:Uncharacterized protein n=1 Tax=Gossypium stocksii TaxID=47602 RepID=A0A9D3VXC0_9ROSI|nr:hypothetical protein J1N35_015122 [Gossypium stocksii]